MHNSKRHIFGQAHPQRKILGGIIKKGYDIVFGPMPLKVRKMLNKIGNQAPRDIRVVRAPVNRYVDTILNAVSLGKWDDLKVKYNYDTFFDLSTVFVCNDIKYRFEKNEIITLTEYKERPDEESVYAGESVLTLSEIIEKTIQRVGESQFYQYNAFTANCQMFIRDILSTAGIWTTYTSEFVLQDINQLVEQLPEYVKRFAKETTDLAGAVSKIGELIP